MSAQHRMICRESSGDNEAPDVTLLVKDPQNGDIELAELDHEQPADEQDGDQHTAAAPSGDTATPAERHRRSVLYWITFVAMGLMVGSVGPLLPILYADVGQSSEEVGGDRGRGKLVPVFVARPDVLLVRVIYRDSSARRARARVRTCARAPARIHSHAHARAHPLLGTVKWHSATHPHQPVQR